MEDAEMPITKKTSMPTALLLLLFISVPVVLASPPIRDRLPFPLWIKHTLNRFIQPRDLYDPLILDSFNFGQANFSKSYSFQPKYAEYYELGISEPTGAIPSSYTFKGSLKIEIIHKGQKILDALADSAGVVWYSDKTLKYYKQIALFSFEVPLQGRYREGLELKVTVLKPDTSLADLGVNPQLYIAVSSTP